MKFRYVSLKKQNYVLNLLENPLGVILFPFFGSYAAKIYPVKIELLSKDDFSEKKGSGLSTIAMIFGLILGQRLDFVNKYSLRISLIWSSLLFCTLIALIILGVIALSKKTSIERAVQGMPANVQLKRKAKVGLFIEIPVIVIATVVIKEAISRMMILTLGSLSFGFLCALFVFLCPIIILASAELEYKGEILKLKSFNNHNL